MGHFQYTIIYKKIILCVIGIQPEAAIEAIQQLMYVFDILIGSYL